MSGLLSGGEIEVYVINPREQTEARYWPAISETIRLAQSYGATGILCFTGNDALIDPWLVAQQVALATPLAPLVALNPVTMPPFTAARMVSSLAHLYSVKVRLNLVTGLSSRDRAVLQDDVSHDDRYQRLEAYASIVCALLAGPHPVTVANRWYNLHQALLPARPSPDLLPELFLAGQSEAARATAARLGAIRVEMMKEPDTESSQDCARLALHFGLVARTESDKAWAEAESLFPPDPVGEQLQGVAMRHTDSWWKHEMWERASTSDSSHASDEVSWLVPFRTFRADCPFLVGAVETLAGRIAVSIQSGVRHFILDLAPREEDYMGAAAAFEMARAVVANDR